MKKYITFKLEVWQINDYPVIWQTTNLMTLCQICPVLFVVGHKDQFSIPNFLLNFLIFNTNFLLYVNDICRVSDILKFYLFANNTNIKCSGQNMFTYTLCK